MSKSWLDILVCARLYFLFSFSQTELLTYTGIKWFSVRVAWHTSGAKPTPPRSAGTVQFIIPSSNTWQNVAFILFLCVCAHLGHFLCLCVCAWLPKLSLIQPVIYRLTLLYNPLSQSKAGHGRRGPSGPRVWGCGDNGQHQRVGLLTGRLAQELSTFLAIELALAGHP